MYAAAYACITTMHTSMGHPYFTYGWGEGDDRILYVLLCMYTMLYAAIVAYGYAKSKVYGYGAYIRCVNRFVIMFICSRQFDLFVIFVVCEAIACHIARRPIAPHSARRRL